MCGLDIYRSSSSESNKSNDRNHRREERKDSIGRGNSRNSPREQKIGNDKPEPKEKQNLKFEKVVPGNVSSDFIAFLLEEWKLREEKVVHFK